MNTVKDLSARDYISAGIARGSVDWLIAVLRACCNLPRHSSTKSRFLFV